MQAWRLVEVTHQAHVPDVERWMVLDDYGQHFYGHDEICAYVDAIFAAETTIRRWALRTK